MLTPRDRERLRVAQQLAAPLREPVRPLPWLPDYYWDRLANAHRRLGIVRQRRWRAALPLAQLALARAVEDLASHLRSLAGFAELAALPPAVPSLRDLHADLLALEDEFAEVRWDLRQRLLAVVTDPVELEGVFLGRFLIELPWQLLSQAKPYAVRALEPQPAASDETVVHPHVRDNDLCDGEGRVPIQTAFREGRLLDAFLLIRQVLQTYNRQSAYIPLSQWHGVVCPDCGTTIAADALEGCVLCRTEGCPECVSVCDRCHSTVCSGCQAVCSACQETCCQACLAPCPACHESFCSLCLSGEVCDACQAEDPDDVRPVDPASESDPDSESAVETASADPGGGRDAATAVQSVGVGQAPVPA